jgi:hypothetical protein
LPDVAPAGAWQYSATIYAYLPALSGSSSFPTGSGGSPIDLSVDKILSTLKFTFMGDIEAHNGQWGAFTDVIYFDLGADKTNTRDFSIGNIGLPAGTTANLDLDLKAWIWTLAGAYRVASSSQWTVDVIGGARMLDLRERLKWNLSGNIGPISPPTASAAPSSPRPTGTRSSASRAGMSSVPTASGRFRSTWTSAPASLNGPGRRLAASAMRSLGGS